MFFRGCATTYDYGKIHGLGWGRAPELCYSIDYEQFGCKSLNYQI